MDDKTIIIIMFAINMVMWWLTLDFMIKTKQFENEVRKRNDEYLKKNAEYWHSTFQNINQMTEMNMTAMKHFSEQITDIMSNEGVGNAAENRK